MVKIAQNHDILISPIGRLKPQRCMVGKICDITCDD
jgi:hypothetical protein